MHHDHGVLGCPIWKQPTFLVRRNVGYKRQCHFFETNLYRIDDFHIKWEYIVNCNTSWGFRVTDLEPCCQHNIDILN